MTYSKINSQFKSKVFKAAGKIFAKRYRIKSAANWSKALKAAWAWAKTTLLAVTYVIDGDIIRETAKAVCVRFELDFYDYEVDRDVNVWFPKSQIKDGVVPAWLVAEKKADVAARFPAHANFHIVRGVAAV